jgi:hypothetical protein
MRSIWNGSRPASSGKRARLAARRRWRLVAGLVTPLAAMGLATAFATAAYAAPPAPSPGITPGAATAGAGGPVDLFYTATDGTVWTGPAGGTPGPFTQVSNGRLTSGPSAIVAGGTEYVFGQASDHALWWASSGPHGSWTNWSSLGGNITSKPGAVFRGPSAQDYSVYARGTDGAVWARDHSTAGWGGWHSIGGNLLTGVGPAAAYISGTYVLVVGIDKQLYIQHVGVTGFTKAGGQTTAAPALAAISGALVGFVRGTDSVGYYHRFLNTSPGWNKMGGVFNSGLTAVGVGSTTYTFGLGTDNQVYRNIGTWTSYPPTFSGWAKVTG